MAVVTPLSMEPSLDVQDIKNYGLVSYLTVVSKFVDRVAVKAEFHCRCYEEVAN